MKRMLTLTLTLGLVLSCLLCGATALASDIALVRYVPTQLVVTDDQIAVDGYFVNLNESGTLNALMMLSMDLYQNGELIVSDDFYNIGHLSVAPLGTEYHSFTFDGPHGLENGTYICNDDIYVVSHVQAYGFY